MQTKKVVLYTTPTCGFCKMAKQYFRDHQVEFSEHDVQADLTAREEMVSKSGQLGVPVITVGDEVIIGFDRDKLGELLEV